MNHQNRSILILIFFSIVLASCQRTTIYSPTSFDEWLQTPIAESTLFAYKGNTIVTNKKQAVIAARASLLTSRVHPINNPRVVSVDFISYKDAIIHMQATESEQRAINENVWLVNFKGDFNFSPPYPTPTGENFFGNVFVLLLTDGNTVITWKKTEP
ncbi:MAG: hypothetical protein JXB15_12285 [Anaerolineales bacterium]|nr:hypothetical protein [Anaerolineales bacterium]